MAIGRWAVCWGFCQREHLRFAGEGCRPNHGRIPVCNLPDIRRANQSADLTHLDFFAIYRDISIYEHQSGDLGTE